MQCGNLLLQLLLVVLCHLMLFAVVCYCLFKSMSVACIFRLETHKNDVMLFCQSMSAACRRNSELVDCESAELLWRFLELLIKQNGVQFFTVFSVMVG